MRYLLIIGSLGLLVIVAWGFMSSAPRIEVSPQSVDFGDIDQAGGVVSADVVVTNSGTKALEFNRISTSCGCTTTDMDTSPLAPGASRVLTIHFDPMAHPDQHGFITRAVYLQTSDPTQPELEIGVTGNVIPVK